MNHAEIGLYNYNARLYDPVIGRFISADTVVPDFSNPQDLDRYAYCGNNPLNSIDPSGHFRFGRFFKIFAVAVVAAVVTVVTYGAAAAAGWSAVAAMAAGGAAGGAVAGALTAAVFGGGPADIFKGLVMGGVMGGLGGAVVGAWAPAAYGMLAAGAGYSAYKGGLEGLAYFGAGVAGAVLGAGIASWAKAELFGPAASGEQPLADESGWSQEQFKSGSSLPESTKGQLRPYFQEWIDLNKVRVYRYNFLDHLMYAFTGNLAYAREYNLSFHPDYYNPLSSKGIALIGHELYHTMDQVWTEGGFWKWYDSYMDAHNSVGYDKNPYEKAAYQMQDQIEKNLTTNYGECP